MPALFETLALPAPPPGGLKDATPSTLEIVPVEDRHIERPKPAPVASQTKSIGMIHPPPDIRSIVDKTATFVARNGPEFEKRILATNKGNAKFNFLNPTDPYHAYYRHKVSENQVQAGILPTPPLESKLPGDKTAAEAAEKKPMQILPPPKPMAAPDADVYSVQLPEHITSLELEMIKLTAQFVARNGKSFLTGLTSREHSNPQFHFLKPTHSYFSLFTSLADAYSKILMPPQSVLEKLRKNVENPSAILEKSLAVLEWEKSQERARQRAEDELEAEREQMALIDWHDFVVVETIDFLDEEEPGLPQPLSLEEVIRSSKQIGEEEELPEEDRAAIAKANGVEFEPEKDEKMEMDEDEVRLVREGLQEEEERIDEDVEMEVENDEDAPMKIVHNWKRPEERLGAGAAGAQGSEAGQWVVSPITGELIPVSAMSEHLRISLIDPKYREQKERALAKVRENTLAADSEIGRHIESLARTRPDIFGTTEEEITNAVKAETERKSNQKEEQGHVVWDGHTGSIGRTANQAMTRGLQAVTQGEEGVNKIPPPPPPQLSAPPAAPPLRPLPAVVAATISQPPMPPQYSLPSAPVGPPMGANQGLPPGTIPPIGLMRPGVPGQMGFPPQFAPMGMMPRPGLGIGGIGAMGGLGMPLPPGHLEEPEAKRSRIDEVTLIPESQFLAAHPGPTRLVVLAPNVEGEPSLNGQTVEVSVDSLSETTGALKERISRALGVPASKQKLSGRAGFFKDNLTLAFYNVGPGELVTLGLKERGGRRK